MANGDQEEGKWLIEHFLPVTRHNEISAADFQHKRPGRMALAILYQAEAGRAVAADAEAARGIQWDRKENADE